MEMTTTKIIDRIAKIDSELLPRMLLTFYDASFGLYCDIGDGMEGEWESTISKLGLKDSHFFVEQLLTYLGFPEDDEIADGYITDYVGSEETNRMGILKKELIEWAIESENY